LPLADQFFHFGIGRRAAVRHLGRDRLSPHAAIDAGGGLIGAAQLGKFDVPSLRREFANQGAFLYLPDFLPAEVTAQLVAAVGATDASVNRNYLPRHKRGGSVSRHAIDRLAPFIAELYRSPALMNWLSQVSGEPLQPSP